MNKPKGKTLVFERELQHDCAKVWDALTDANKLAQWLMPNDFVAEVGHRFTFQTKPAPGFDGVVHCEVLELLPRERLVFRWAGGGIDTQVTFELEEVGASQTRLRLTHAGFEGLRARMVAQILKGGWKKMLERDLPAVLNETEAEGCAHEAPATTTRA